MSGQQPPPHPGPYGQEQPGQQPPYPGPPAQPPPYPGPYGQPAQPPYGQQPYPPAQYPQQYAGQQPYQGQQYQGQYPQYAGQHQGYAPAVKTPPDSTAKMIGWAIAATGLIVAIAAFLTWASVDFGGQSIEVNGVTGTDVPGDDDTSDGVVTLVLAILAIGFAAVRGFGQLSLTAAIIGTVMGALVTLIAIVDIADPEGDVTLPPGVEFSIGIGLWLTLAGGILMALVSVFGIVKRQRGVGDMGA